MKPLRIVFTYLAIVLMASFLAGAAHAQVPVRISIKFILDANGNRPSTGRLNTDAEINAEFTAGINALSNLYSELSIEQIELVDLTGATAWSSTSAATIANRDALRNAAIADPATFLWRTDAINIYINGGPSSAISDFPPNNNIILMNQGCTNTPSCILHEIGHCLSLWHTHQANQPGVTGDECGDTISDNQSWTKDQLAQNNYGCTFANCTAAQQDAVSLVYNNVMSYHVDEPQNRLSPCQMDRISSQSDSDKNWLLSKMPVYVDNGKFVILQLGTFGLPYTSLQNALNSGGLANRVLVLEQGAYSTSQELINASVEIVTRSGPSSFTRQGFQAYKLPVDIENSPHPKVRAGVRAAQDEDRAERKIARDAEDAEKKAGKRQDKAAIRADAKLRRKPHQENALKGLIDAEQYAEGDEKLAIQMELGERYRDAGDCKSATQYFIKVADATDQPNLRKAALYQAENCGKKTPVRKR